MARRLPTGFTLIELLAVVLIMSILLGLAITGYHRVAKGSGVTTTTHLIVSSLESARQAAITRNNAAAVVFDTAGSTVHPGAHQFQALVRDPYLNSDLWPDSYLQIAGNEKPHKTPVGVALLFAGAFPRPRIIEYVYRKESESGSWSYMTTAGTNSTIWRYQLSTFGSTNRYAVVFDAYGQATATATIIVAEATSSGYAATNWAAYNHAQIIVQQGQRQIKVLRP